MKFPAFEVYQDRRKAWRWRLKAANGRVIASGESHTRERDARRALLTVVDTAIRAASLIKPQ